MRLGSGEHGCVHISVRSGFNRLHTQIRRGKHGRGVTFHEVGQQFGSAVSNPVGAQARASSSAVAWRIVSRNCGRGPHHCQLIDTRFVYIHTLRNTRKLQSWYGAGSVGNSNWPKTQRIGGSYTSVVFTAGHQVTNSVVVIQSS